MLLNLVILAKLGARKIEQDKILVLKSSLETFHAFWNCFVMKGAHHFVRG
jgi:hypothetical protein